MSNIQTYYEYLDKYLPEVIYFDIIDISGSDIKVYQLNADMYSRSLNTRVAIGIMFAVPNYSLVDNDTYFSKLAQKVLDLLEEEFKRLTKEDDNGKENKEAANE